MNLKSISQKDQMLPSDYLKKPYSRIVVPDEATGTYAAFIAEFPGCIAQGLSASDAVTQLEEVAAQWIAVALGSGQKIPEPYVVGECSGKFALRLPRSLHQQAAEFAAREDVSLNQFFATVIAQHIGAKGMFNQFAEFVDRKLMTAVTAIEHTIQANVTYVGDSQLSNPCTARTSGTISFSPQVRH